MADVAVIGIPDERAGELPKAFVVKQKGAEDMTEQDVMDYVNAKVRSFVFPRLVHFRLFALPLLPENKQLYRFKGRAKTF